MSALIIHTMERLRRATIESSVGLFVCNRSLVEFRLDIGRGSSSGKGIRSRNIFRNAIDTGTRADVNVIYRLEYTTIGCIYVIRNESKGEEGGSRKISDGVA